MFFVINENSLCGQYRESKNFKDHLHSIMKCRRNYRFFSENLYCSRLIGECKIDERSTFREVVQKDRLISRPVLEWLNKKGPFCRVDFEEADSTWWVNFESEVTNAGLGEASRFLDLGDHGYSISFPNGGFDYSPVKVVRDLEETDFHEINNFWDIPNLDQLAISALPEPESWAELRAQLEERFREVDLINDALSAAEAHPFNSVLSRNIMFLLSILNEFVVSLNNDGSHSPQSTELVENFFTGDRARFSDESANNKRQFRKELTFTDNNHNEEKIFCPWHGKISHLTFRIHFEWPLHEKKKIRVFYIGPKITKQ